MDKLQAERFSLNLGKWANLFMAFAGVAAALLSNASALMLDGVFSGVNFLAAIFAARIATSVERQPDARRPFGYEIEEPIYVMFRSLVLSGILLIAGLNAVFKIYQYARGDDLPPIELGWVTLYAALMTVICFGLAALHHRAWKRTGKASQLLATERTSTFIDGILSLAAGAAFLVIHQLQGTFLGFLVPISDAVVVLVLVIAMVPQPIRLLRGAMCDVVGAGVEGEALDEIRSAVIVALDPDEFFLLDLSVLRSGRSFIIIPYLQPNRPLEPEVFDRTKAAMTRECGKILAPSRARVDAIITQEPPFLEH